jgi:tRNA-Thr(GGU) m(6)t(6)A37 methyltransferase TsaA
MEWSIKQIGVIHTSFNDMKDVPIQGIFKPDGKGIVEVFSEYQEGLKDIESFSHIILLYYFHLVKELVLQRKPFLDDKEHGIFSIRAPNRPNPIGLSIVKLLEIKENKLFVSEIDMIDGTPLIDIKPYVPDFDVRIDATKGWLKDKI